MNPTRIERHLRALSLAKECVLLGARPSTVAVLTGLSKQEVARLFCDSEAPRKPGRRPNVCEWFHRSNLIMQIEASCLYSIYWRMRCAAVGPVQSLIAAYKEYSSRSTSDDPPPLSDHQRACAADQLIDDVGLAIIG